MSRAPYYVLVAAFGLMTLGGFALAAPTPAELGWIEHEMTCAEWFEAPEVPTGSTRLTECALAPGEPRLADSPGNHSQSVSSAQRNDTLAAPEIGALHDVDGVGVIEAAARLHPAGVDPARLPPMSGRPLVLVTHDPDLRRLADTFTDHDQPWRTIDVGAPASDSRDRFGQRHAEELRRARTVEGVVEDVWRSSHAGLAGPLASAGPGYVIAPVDSGRASRAPGIVLATFGGLALLLLVLAQRRWTRRREELTGAADRPLTF